MKMSPYGICDDLTAIEFLTVHMLNLLSFCRSPLTLPSAFPRHQHLHPLLHHWLLLRSSRLFARSYQPYGTTRYWRWVSVAPRSGTRRLNSCLFLDIGEPRP